MPGEDARAKAIVLQLREGNASSDEVFAAFEELDQLPPDVVRRTLEAWTGPAPDLENLDDSIRRAHRLPLRTPRLETLHSAHDADVLDLGALVEEQLRVAGKTWDGQDLEPWDRLDGEREDSFAGTLERRVVGEHGKPLYDLILFGEGSGVFFRAGTTDVLGVIAEHRVETTDRSTRLALQEALSKAPVAPTAAPLPAPEPTDDDDAPASTPVQLPLLIEESEAKTTPKKKTAAKKKKAAAAAPKKKAAAAPKKKATAKKKTAAKKTTKKKAASD